MSLELQCSFLPACPANLYSNTKCIGVSDCVCELASGARLFAVYAARLAGQATCKALMCTKLPLLSTLSGSSSGTIMAIIRSVVETLA